jgi:hypothetical protein
LWVGSVLGSESPSVGKLCSCGTKVKTMQGVGARHCCPQAMILRPWQLGFVKESKNGRHPFRTENRAQHNNYCAHTVHVTSVSRHTHFSDGTAHRQIRLLLAHTHQDILRENCRGGQHTVLDK